MAERSKALASGASVETRVGSNPTLVNTFLHLVQVRMSDEFGCIRVPFSRCSCSAKRCMVNMSCTCSLRDDAGKS
ncbi:hypothetical protein EJ06DRAFT_531019 [Trichodelitschia bisporula]|uniref:Uncharacterized protein n=1 Tax=Trichodelitschia bisporula TaxID=703511 RepID=A0A6G1HU95_9PEZI|nr:hypothetical protein EJ06DRAFT_531019 [Trichodelitschia bisporula]